MKEVKEFFAITISGSLYRIWLDEKGEPWVEKIGRRYSCESEICTGEKLLKGHFVGITKIGIITYDPEGDHDGRRRPEFINTRYWRSRTSGIAALFLDKSTAVCAFTENDNFELNDSRWRFETLKTIEVISGDHPRFVISIDPSLSLLPLVIDEPDL